MYEVLYLPHEAGQKNTTTKNSKYAKQHNKNFRIVHFILPIYL